MHTYIYICWAKPARDRLLGPKPVKTSFLARSWVAGRLAGKLRTAFVTLTKLFGSFLAGFLGSGTTCRSSDIQLLFQPASAETFQQMKPN